MKREIRTHQQLDETIIRTVHSSGLELVMMPKPGYQSAHGGFFVQYGSIHNQYMAEGKQWNQPAGIAHFLEHKIFESAKDNIFSLFASREAAVNAYTNFVSTCYYFSSTGEYEANLKELLNFVQTPHITEENVEKEKGIIAQEIKMYEDNPDWRVYFNLLKALYKNHPVRTDIAGTVESIGEITAPILLKAYRHWYTPERMKVVMVGNVDPDRSIDAVLASLTPEFLSRRSGASMVPVDEPVSVSEARIAEEFPTTIPTFYMGLKDNSPLAGAAGQTQYATASVMMDILFGKSSELYQQLMGKGLIAGALGMEYSMEADYAYGMVGSESLDPEGAWQHIDNFLTREAGSLITDDEVERVKRKTIGRFLQACNSVESLARMTVTMVNRGMDLFDYYDALQALDSRQVRERFEIMTQSGRRALSVIRPK